MKVWSLSSALLAAAVMCAAGCASLARYDGRIEPVEFFNGPVRLVGILVEPKGSAGPFPAAGWAHWLHQSWETLRSSS